MLPHHIAPAKVISSSGRFVGGKVNKLLNKQLNV